MRRVTRQCVIEYLNMSITSLSTLYLGNIASELLEMIPSYLYQWVGHGRMIIEPHVSKRLMKIWMD